MGSVRCISERHGGTFNFTSACAHLVCTPEVGRAAHVRTNSRQPALIFCDGYAGREIGDRWEDIVMSPLSTVDVDFAETGPAPRQPGDGASFEHPHTLLQVKALLLLLSKERLKRDTGFPGASCLCAWGLAIP